jgi:acyl transferase domain-containing protein/NADPH:quinone reductase-like Zn-dependent oxidoreductase/short-subunit dehydrogenase/acyl carrier protein
VAVVGLGVRFPGKVSSRADLVSFLQMKGDGVVDVPPDRWNSDRFYSADKDAPGRMYVRRAAFLHQDVFAMDPAPFNLSPRECEQLDPQQRLLLEAAWDAFEDAGIAVTRLSGSSTGVYVGGFMLDARDVASFPESRRLVEGHFATGVGNTVLSNRISYTFDLQGPSLTVDTACSSSLVTVHLACRDLADATCDLALAGGVNVMLSPLSTLLMCKGQFLSPDGRSKTFDASADGYGRGEGAGLVVLKRLDDAVRDGDRIYATILATGVNQDGRTDGMPFPNRHAQVALSSRVSRQAGIDPKRVGYVEAHGTGTKAGDTTEVQALSEVYAGPDRAVPLAMGSIKTNIGHLEAAAGVAGLIKASLSLYHRTIFPLRDLKTPNPAIDFAGSGVRVPLTTEPWPEGTDLTAAVNSFGYGGTNAHAVLGAAPESTAAEAAAQASGPRWLTVSACDEMALKARCEELAALAESEIDELASSLAHHRAHLRHRAVIFAESPEQARDALLATARGQHHEDVIRDRADVTKLCCVYTGMGPQWWGMGRALFETEPAFRDAALEVSALFQRCSGWSLLEEMMRPEAESRMASNRVAQPANFLLQVALTRALWSKGVAFAGYLGHSVGELTAAWATGCLSLEQATFAAFHRSDLQQRVAGKGTMLATELGLEEGMHYCRKHGDLAVAAINGPKSIVLSGGKESLDAVAQALEAKGVFSRFMRVEVAYHSHHMDPLEPAFFERLALLTPNAPSAPLFSTAFGAEVDGAVHDAGYWWKNARMPVLLAPALTAALARGFDGFLEVGPHPVLVSAILASAREAAVPVKSFAVLDRNQAQDRAFLRSLGALHAAGVTLDLDALVPRRSRLELPAYPFQRKRFWAEGTAEAAYRTGRPGAHPLLDQRRDGGGVRWHTELDDTRFGWLSGHRVLGARVFPGAGYLELGFAACAETFAKGNLPVLEDVLFEQALVLPESGFSTLVVELSGQTLGIHAEADTGVTRHATMRLAERARYARPESLDLTAALEGLVELPIDEVYRELAQAGLAYAGAFRCLERVFRDDDRVVCRVAPSDRSDYWIFPACLDAVFQSLLVLGRLDQAIVPVRARSVRCLARSSGPLYAVATRSPGASAWSFDVQVWDEHGEPVLTIECLECAPIDRARQLRPSELAWLHGKAWAPAPTKLGLRAIRPLYLSGDDGEPRALVAAALKAARQPHEHEIPPGARAPHVIFVAAPKHHDPTGRDVLLALVETVRTLPDGAELTVLTRGAYSIAGEPAHPAAAAIVGLARVIMTERPELNARVVDLPLAGMPDAGVLRDALLGRDEEECALREDVRHALRIVRVPPRDEARRAERRPALPGEICELFVERPGTIDGLSYRPRAFELDLAPDEVEIDVECASLNFKDLMKVTGLIGDASLERTALGKTIGIEAAGRALRIGSAVTHVQPGQLVVGFRGGMATRTRSPGHLTVAASRTHGPVEASCLLVFMTAWHALVERAKVGPGEKILIHAATGGVGLAAVQIARHLGAEIYATAGRPHKRELLATLGVRHVYDSRTLDYAQLIRRDTRGYGVDVVLNSLPGEHLRRSVDLLASGGRFVEIGKQDFAENTELGLSPFTRALSFFAVDLDRMSLETPQFFRPLAESVCRAFDDGILQPLPTEVFPAAAIGEAFRFLADADRVGKVVVDFRSGVGEVAPNHQERAFLRQGACYLVVGGLDGFGLRTAEWLAENGAGEVVLASRRGRPTPAAARVLDRLSASTGCSVRCEALDVTDALAVSRLVGSLASSDRPLRGVFHAAAVLEDEPLNAITADALSRVLGAKALGAHHLHLATREIRLDHFVLFGSVSALVGNPGQGSYAAANAFLDGLAALRRSEGLPATCISWGAIDDVGMVARDGATRAHLQSIGFTAMKPDRALAALQLALEEQRTEHAIVAADWSKWQRHAPSTPWQRLSAITEEDESGTRSDALAARLAALPEADRLAEVRTLLVEAIAPTFKLSPAEFDADKPLRDLGLDSLVAVELQAQVEAKLGVELSTMELLAGRPASALASTVLSRLELRTDAVESSALPPSVSIMPGNLRAFFLERICVQPPYFALESIEQDGDWLTAHVTPAPLPAAANEAMAVAEMARHAAILGSCAARLEYSDSDGRVFFPVQHSTLLEYTGAAWPEKAFLKARCTSFDARRSTAVALAEFSTLEGTLVGSFEVTYHVIAEADFERLFAARARPTHEASGGDPYRAFAPAPNTRAEPGQAATSLGAIGAERCLGHFVGFPAYPVSIMVRDCFATLHEALCTEHGVSATWVVQGGTCQTRRFVFADEVVEIRCSRRKAHGRREEWVCDIMVGDEVTAWLDVVVHMTSSDITDLDLRFVADAEHPLDLITQSAE